MNPRNGICINPLHDRAFELGYLGIDRTYKIHISTAISEFLKDQPLDDYFKKFDKRSIHLPDRYLPDPKFLEYHMDVKFKS